MCLALSCACFRVSVGLLAGEQLMVRYIELGSVCF